MLEFDEKSLAWLEKYVVGCNFVKNGCFFRFWSMFRVPNLRFLPVQLKFRLLDIKQEVSTLNLT